MSAYDHSKDPDYTAISITEFTNSLFNLPIYSILKEPRKELTDEFLANTKEVFKMENSTLMNSSSWELANSKKPVKTFNFIDLEINQSNEKLKQIPWKTPQNSLAEIKFSDISRANKSGFPRNSETYMDIQNIRVVPLSFPQKGTLINLNLLILNKYNLIISNFTEINYQTKRKNLIKSVPYQRDKMKTVSFGNTFTNEPTIANRVATNTVEINKIKLPTVKINNVVQNGIQTPRPLILKPNAPVLDVSNLKYIHNSNQRPTSTINLQPAHANNSRLLTDKIELNIMKKPYENKLMFKEPSNLSKKADSTNSSEAKNSSVRSFLDKIPIIGKSSAGSKSSESSSVKSQNGYKSLNSQELQFKDRNLLLSLLKKNKRVVAVYKRFNEPSKTATATSTTTTTTITKPITGIAMTTTTVPIIKIIENKKLITSKFSS